MSRLPIRVRLTLVFVLVMAAVLAITGSFLFLHTKHSIDDSIAQSLRARQGAARAYAESAGLHDGRSQIPPGERFAQILDPQGRVLVSRPVAGKPLLSPGQAAVAARALHGFELHERDRYLAGPARVGGHRVVVVVAASLADHERALEGLGGALLVGGPIALLLAAAIAYLIAAGALGPVEQMRQRAATISTADPTAQLPEPQVDDELRRLAQTLNAMLRRIARSAEHERRFIADASHELRTPLAALQAELEITERHATTPDEFRAAIARSRQDVARLIHLSNGLLDLAATEKPDRQSDARDDASVDVDELLRLAAADMRHRAHAGNRVLTVRPSGLSVRGDATPLRRAVANLIENALVHGSGPVTVAADLSDPRTLTISVYDTGTLHPAMADGEAFARFGRGPDTADRPGAGLGLAIVDAIAKAHNGSAVLCATPDGVCASLHLPHSGAAGEEDRDRCIRRPPGPPTKRVPL